LGIDNEAKPALFCIAQVNTTNFVAVGGHSGKIEKSVETIKGNDNIPDMQTARNGHACAGIGGDKIVVAGGSDTSHRWGGKALKTSEMYSADTNRWERVGDMVHERFGHALVNIGGRIIAVGGKEWNPDVTLRNGEEFNPVTKTWSSIGDVMAVPRLLLDMLSFLILPFQAVPYTSSRSPFCYSRLYHRHTVATWIMEFHSFQPEGYIKQIVALIFLISTKK